MLQSRGFTFDYVSDRQLRETRSVRGRLLTKGGSEYRVLVLPSSRFMPLETVEHIVSLARSGATVVAVGGGPADVAGLAALETRRERFRRALTSLKSTARTAAADADLETTLAGAGVGRERLVDRGLAFARRTDPRGRFYFINNRGERGFEGWVPLTTARNAAIVLDAMTGRRGTAPVRRADAETLEVYLQIPAAESLIVIPTARGDEAFFGFYEDAGPPVRVDAPWSVRFTKGGPSLPAPRTIDRLGSWTGFDASDDVRSFSGTAVYSTTFPAPAGEAVRWRLDLGRVRESARVRLNGRDLGTLIGPWFRVVLEKEWIRPSNVLEVAVANLAANRIAALDRAG
jgi:hypothetical protein